MKGLKVLIIIMATLCGTAFLLPKEITVTRTVEINSSIEDVFEQANTLKNWINWSPWHEMDPDANYTYSNLNEGAGASYSWNGNPELVGAGHLTILESTLNKSVNTEVVFLNDGKENGRGKGKWRFTEDGLETKVSWSFTVDMGNNPVARWIGLVIDSMLGPQLEKGLSNMKEYLETLPKKSD